MDFTGLTVVQRIFKRLDMATKNIIQQLLWLLGPSASEFP